jgi:hypothetical protein
MPGEMLNVTAQLLVRSVPPVLLKNDSGLGLRIEWEVEKSITTTPDKAKIRIYNLAKVSRAAIEAAAALPVPTKVDLYIGWRGLLPVGVPPTLLFSGTLWKVIPELWDDDYTGGVTRAGLREERTGLDIVTELEATDGGVELRDTPASGTTAVAIGVNLALNLVLGQLGVTASPAAIGIVVSRAAALPVQAFQDVSHLDPEDQLDALMATIGLSYSFKAGFFVVYEGGLIKEELLVNLGPQSGLLRVNKSGAGAIEFEALAQAEVGPGTPVQFFEKLTPAGVPIPVLTGGPVGVESVIFRGATEGPSLMEGVAREVQVII